MDSTLGFDKAVDDVRPIIRNSEKIIFFISILRSKIRIDIEIIH